MGPRVPPNQVWKQTPDLITLESVDSVIREIEQETEWTPSSIRRKLFERKMLIRTPAARYHIYRDSLG